MSTSDSTTSMLTCIRNAQAVEKASMAMPSSKLKVVIAKVLKDKGHIDGFTVTEQDGKSMLTIGLKYYAGRPIMGRLERVSKPGLRVYKGHNEIPQVMNGLGVTIISTPQGPTMDRRTRATDVSGGIICYVT